MWQLTVMWDWSSTRKKSILVNGRRHEERGAMDWLMEDELMMQWEEVGQEEEEITVKRKAMNFKWKADFKWEACKVHQKWLRRMHK